MADAMVAHAHALIELVNFDLLVDAHGEQSVGLIIEEFVSGLKSIKRAGDGLLEVSPTQFCLVLRGVHQRQHINLAMAKLYRALAAPVDVFGDTALLVVRCGIALPGAKLSESKQMLTCAQSALRHAKRQELPHVIFSGSEAAAAREDPNFLARIREALDMGEFVPYFQPKVTAAYGTLVGAEALVRWHDTKLKKVVPPGVFIEQVEESGLIFPLTLHLLKSAIARCANWPEPLHVAVNIPPKLLTEEFLVTAIGDALTVADLDPARLIVEVTERGQMPKLAIEVLSKIGALGVKIAIDDFGTGESSLIQFRRMPANIVKLDQVFVRGAVKSTKDQAIVHAVVELARRCQMQVVAEGVEDQACADLMKKLGCDWLQGYWFGKPVPNDEFVKTHIGEPPKARVVDHMAALLGSE